MIVDDRTAESGLVVAVGPSSVEAARVFGPALDDVVVASYSELADVAASGPLASLHLVVAPGCEAVADRLAEHLAQGLRLEVAAAVEHHPVLAAVLSQHSLRIEQVRDLGRDVAFEVAPAQDVAGHNRVVLESVALSARPGPGPSQGSEQTPARSTRAARSRRARGASPTRRPVPLLVRGLDRLTRLVGGRRGAVVVAAGLALLALVLAVVAAAGSVAASTLLLLVLGGAAAASGAAAVVAVLLLARQVHRQTARLEQLLAAHEESLRAQGRRQSRRDAVLTRETELTHDYLDAIATAAALQSRDVQLALADLAAKDQPPR